MPSERDFKLVSRDFSVSVTSLSVSRHFFQRPEDEDFHLSGDLFRNQTPSLFPFFGKITHDHLCSSCFMGKPYFQAGKQRHSYNKGQKNYKKRLIKRKYHDLAFHTALEHGKSHFGGIGFFHSLSIQKLRNGCPYLPPLPQDLSNVLRNTTGRGT